MKPHQRFIGMGVESPQPHLLVNCTPVPVEIAEVAGMYDGDPYFELWQAEVKRYREERDRDDESA